MKQILQDVRSGKLEIADVPAPMPNVGQIVVQNHYSVMSPGTDKLAMSFAQKSMLGKARSRPDLVKQVVTKVQQEGLESTYRTVVSRLEAPQPLGYSSAGIVRAVGEGVTDFRVGDRVACAGAGYANHAELVAIPKNLAVHVPDGVELSAAAFATLGAIAMQGLRVSDPTLGETAVVVGLGLIGQISIQLLRANGCRVLGLDVDPARVERARLQGAEWVATPGEIGDSWINAETGGLGVDFAVVTAASETAAPLELAASLCRRKGRIGFVGAMPINLDRRLMFENELDLRMSTSYGPGRYDRRYEEQGFDYPVSYVRWTENRNLQAFLQLLDVDAIDTTTLDCEHRAFDGAVEAYEDLSAGRNKSLAVVFEYDREVDSKQSLQLDPPKRAKKSGDVGVAFIGAGNYAKAVLLPVLKSARDVQRITLVTATGPSAKRSAGLFGFSGCSTDPDAVFKDPNVDFVFVTTRHDSHVEYATQALANGKGLWLEKPAALDTQGLQALVSAMGQSRGFVAVGYNRRFSSHTDAIRDHFGKRTEPLKIHYRVASPTPPADSWLMDPNEGGGRVIGEACHFVDLCNALTGCNVTQVFAQGLSSAETDDTFSATLTYEDGSIATLDYLGNASSDLPKEYFEVFSEGRSARCDNFRVTRLSGEKAHKTFNQDKGQATAIRTVVDAFSKGEASPFDLAGLVNVSLVTFAINESIASGQPVKITGDRISLERSASV